MENKIAHENLKKIWAQIGGSAEALNYLNFPGQDPFYASSFLLGTAAQVSIGGAALAAAEIWASETGRRQSISVDIRNAGIEFRSERYFRFNDSGAPSLWDPLAGLYRCGQGFVRVHTNFPHHRNNLLKVLSCEPTRESVQNALNNWKPYDFERAAHSAGCVAAALRSRSEWLEHPQSQAIKNLPLVTIEKISEAPPRPLPKGIRPLSNIKVLDLTRIVAGPVGARALAAYGADVIRVHSPKLPALDWLDRDTGRGKRSVFLDLDSFEDHSALVALTKDADIFMQAYRPGGLDAKGFGPEELFRIKPGLIYVSLSAYGHVGPWSERKGFDSLTQTATGFNLAEAEGLNLAAPKELPCQALDHASGYLMAMGAMIARLRQSKEGGNWHVRVSLAQTGSWVWDLGRSPVRSNGSDPQAEDIRDLMESTESKFGTVSYVRHAADFSETPASWERGSAALGSDSPFW